MGLRGATRATGIAFIAAGLLCVPAGAAQPQADLGALLDAVGDRVASFYQRAEHLICRNLSTVQPIDKNWSWQGFARTVESELRLELIPSDGDGVPEANVVRNIQRVNGRLPRESERKSRSGCTDPNPLSPEPLAFLLPGNREDYHFTSVRNGRERGRAALIIDFTSVNRRSRVELIEDERGHEDCFDWKGPLATRGQVWVDAQTYDVLRIQRGLLGPVDIRVSPKLQRRYQFDSYLTLDRDDVSIRFGPVTFTDPDETLLLPNEIDNVTIVRTGLQSARRTETFSDYQRFLTTGRIK
jgi:hypothetical protein